MGPDLIATLQVEPGLFAHDGQHILETQWPYKWEKMISQKYRGWHEFEGTNCLARTTDSDTSTIAHVKPLPKPYRPLLPAKSINYKEDGYSITRQTFSIIHFIPHFSSKVCITAAPERTHVR